MEMFRAPKGHVLQAEKKPEPKIAGEKKAVNSSGLWIFDDSMDPKSRGQAGQSRPCCVASGAEPQHGGVQGWLHAGAGPHG